MFEGMSVSVHACMYVFACAWCECALERCIESGRRKMCTEFLVLAPYLQFFYERASDKSHNFSFVVQTQCFPSVNRVQDIYSAYKHTISHACACARTLTHAHVSPQSLRKTMRKRIHDHYWQIRSLSLCRVEEIATFEWWREVVWTIRTSSDWMWMHTTQSSWGVRKVLRQAKHRKATLEWVIFNFWACGPWEQTPLLGCRKERLKGKCNHDDSCLCRRKTTDGFDWSQCVWSWFMKAENSDLLPCRSIVIEDPEFL